MGSDVVDLGDAPATTVPEALRAVHRRVPVGGVVRLRLVAGAGWGDDPARRLADVVEGAGFDGELRRRAGVWSGALERLRTLPDTVAAGMRLVVLGLNPSVVAADAGFGFAGPTNRFWKAAVAAGIVTATRDPGHALLVDGVGMTDLVKRATPRSAEVTADEYRAGAGRVDRLVAWLQPGAVCVVGLEGWRVAVDHTARPGWQPGRFGGRPAYVLPSTSGLNASVRLDDLVAHLRQVAAGPPVPT